MAELPTTFADMAARLVALESRDIVLKDLPLKQLMSKLEQDWDPDGSQLLGLHSVTADNVAPGVFLLLAIPGTDLKVAVGNTTLTWSGVSPISQITPVNHSLGKVPQWVGLTLFGSAHLTLRVSPAPDTIAFNATGQTTDGSSPLVAQVDPIYWAAIG